MEIGNLKLNSAQKFLETLGWKVSKSKLYADAKAGKITMDHDGTATPAALVSYAILSRVARPGDKVQALDSEVENSKRQQLELRKLEAETLHKEEQAERERLKREREAGELIPKVDVFREFAGRIVLFEQSSRQFFRRKVRSIIALVGGDVSKEPDVVALYDAELDKVLNQFAQSKGLIAELRKKQ